MNLTEYGLYKEAEELRNGGYRCAVGCSRTYNKRFSHVLALVAIAKADYPTLQDDDIEFVIYGGDRRRKMMAVEFEVATLVDGYYVRSSLELLIG